MTAATTAVDERAPVAPAMRAAVAAAGAGAAAIHFAMVPAHAQDWLPLGIGFAVIAWLQAITGVAAAFRPDRRTLTAVVGVHVVATVLWAWSRTAGFPLGPHAGESEAMAAVDLTSVALQVAGIVAAAGIGHMRRSSTHHASRLRPVASFAAAAIVAGSLVGTSAVLASPSAVHGHGDGAHGEEGHVAAADSGDDGHQGHEDDHGQDGVHEGRHGADDHHAHESTDAADAAEDGTFTDDDLGDVAHADARQIANARALVTEMEAALARYRTTDDVEAAGYISIGDGRTGYEHYVHIGHIADAGVTDADRIESIVFAVAADGSKEVVSGMYILPLGQTMADVPDLGTGPLTTWHDHQNLCWEGARVVGRLDAAVSCTSGTFRATPPMLHVWVVDHPCGRFAGLEGSHGEGCEAHDH